MKTYYLKYRGTSEVRIVRANTLREAKEKLAEDNGHNGVGYIQQVFKCAYQDMIGEVIS